MNYDLTIYKDNYLVEASYRLSLMEQRIILFTIAKLDPRNPKLKHEFYVKDFLNFFSDLDQRSIYNNLKIAVDKLWDRSVKTEHPEYVQYFRWLSSKQYYKDEGRISLSFTPEVIPYLSQLEKQFTKYQLKNISGFKGSYSIRLYELLTQYKSTGNRGINIQDLRNWLQIGDKYPRYNSFRERVISPAVAEINEKSDLNVEFDTVIQRRTVTALIFTVTSKKSVKRNDRRPLFPHKNKYGKYVHLDKQNPAMSNAEYGNYAHDCLKVLDEYYTRIEDVTLEDLRHYWIFLAVNASHKSKLGSKQKMLEVLRKRGFKLIDCELIKIDEKQIDLVDNL